MGYWQGTRLTRFGTLSCLILPLTLATAAISRADTGAGSALLANEFNRGLDLPDLRDRMAPLTRILPLLVPDNAATL